MKNYLVGLALLSMALAPSFAQADCDYSNGGQAYMTCLLNQWAVAQQQQQMMMQQQQAILQQQQQAQQQQLLQQQQQQYAVQQSVYQNIMQTQQSAYQNYSASYSCPYSFSCTCSDGSWPAYYTLGGSPVFGAGSACCSAAQGGSC